MHHFLLAFETDLLALVYEIKTGYLTTKTTPFSQLQKRGSNIHTKGLINILKPVLGYNLLLLV